MRRISDFLVDYLIYSPITRSQFAPSVCGVHGVCWDRYVDTTGLCRGVHRGRCRQGQFGQGFSGSAGLCAGGHYLWHPDDRAAGSGHLTAAGSFLDRIS